MGQDRASLRLDTSIPRVWRSPDELQFGVDVPLLTLEHVTTVQERLIAALDGGVTMQGLEMLARRAKAKPTEAADLVRTLQPVLGGVAVVPPANLRIHVTGEDHAAALIAHLLRLSGAEPVTCAAGERTAPDVVVLVSDYVITPERAGRWMRRDIPHLPVVFGERRVRIGPLITPGKGPCVRCLHLAATDADAAWPAIATQLSGRSAPSHGPRLDLDAAMVAVAALLGLAGVCEPPDVFHSVTLSVDGRRTRSVHRRHPRCGCATLPGNEKECDRPADRILQPS
jgi:hypothetical protein